MAVTPSCRDHVAGHDIAGPDIEGPDIDEPKKQT